MRILKLCLLTCLTLGLAACNPRGNLDDLAGPERQKIARGYVQRLIDGDIAGLVNEVEPPLRHAETPRVFTEMRALLPPGAPRTVNLIGFGVNRQAKEAVHTLNYQYGYRDQWFLVTVAWREKAGTTREITGLRVSKLDRSLEEANAFTFTRARPRHYAFLAAIIIVPAFILVTLVTCIRLPHLPVKWIWVILIVVGVGRFSLNWTTDFLVLMPVSVQLFGASVVTSGPFSPWVVSFSLPLGAMAFWIRRRQVLRAAAAKGLTAPVR